MKPADPLLSADDLRQLLIYDPATGKLVWRARTLANYSHLAPDRQALCLARFIRKQEGQEAGSMDNGYRRLYVGGKSVYSHRVIWCMVYGEWPQHEIDHINGDRTDNRLANIRDVPAVVNARNQGLRRDNTSGCGGVIWHAQSRKWRAVVQGRFGRHDMGLFPDKDDAERAVLAKRAELGFSADHGAVTRSYAKPRTRPAAM